LLLLKREMNWMARLVVESTSVGVQVSGSRRAGRGTVGGGVGGPHSSRAPSGEAAILDGPAGRAPTPWLYSRRHAPDRHLPEETKPALVQELQALGASDLVPGFRAVSFEASEALSYDCT